jgi:hypothetical protein
MALPAYYRVGRTKFAVVAAASFGLFPVPRDLFRFLRLRLVQASGGPPRSRGTCPGVSPRPHGSNVSLPLDRVAAAFTLVAPGTSSFLPVYPVQADINRAIRAADPEADLNEHWSPITFLLISAGVAFTLLAGIGAFVSETP